MLLHVVDVSGSEGRDPKEDFAAINAELQRFSPQLAAREQLVLGNKCDIASEEQIAQFRAFIEGQGLAFLPISAAAHTGLAELPGLVYELSLIHISRLRAARPRPVPRAASLRPQGSFR